MNSQADAPSAPPTPLAGRWIRYVVGFGVAVGIGLAPFLGKIAGVDALLGLFPKRMHGTLLPTSAFLMGIIAVAVQYHSSEAIPRTRLRRRFSLSLVCLLVGLVVFLAIYSLFVLRVPYMAEGVEESEPVLIGWSRVPSCECPATASDLECLRRISLRAEAIESCWGGRRLGLLGFTFSLAYLSLTGGFAAMVGLLVLQEGQPSHKRRPRRPPAP